jgi:SNF2 family DNA or RNA helicase
MVTIELDKKGQNFVIQAPFHLNHIAQKAPNRKFMRSSKKWFLPGLRLNAKYLQNVSHETNNILWDEGVNDLIDKILERSENRFVPFPPRYNFKLGVEPRTKQVEALNYAWGKQGFFFSMEMGTGKTKIYIDLASAMYLENKIDAMVILTKNSVCRNTIKEIYKHCPLKEYTALSPEFNTKRAKRENSEFISNNNMKFLVMGLESLSVKQGAGKAFEYLWQFMKDNECAMVIDEAHLIKNPSANRAKNVMELGGMAKFRFAGTGTPITNNLLDLYTPYQFINPDILGIGNFYSFKNRYTIKGGFENKEIIGYDNVDELMSLIKPWTFQATKEDMEDLPPKIHMEPVVVPMIKEQRKIYDDIRKNRVAEIESMQDKELVVQSILQTYTLLHQICAGYISYDGDQGGREKQWIVEPDKNPKYKELISILEDNPQVQFNIWTKHLIELEAVYKLLNKRAKTIKLHGSMSKDDREKAIEDFVEGRAKYMIATQETGGTGLTFTNCSNVIYLSNSFKFGDRVQSEDRNHRIGTKKAVTYTDIIMQNSIESRVLEVLREKKSLSDFIRKELENSINMLKTH